MNTTRFTIDGSRELELQLVKICREAAEAVSGAIPSKDIQGLVLGGGYGRGEGGVLRERGTDHPYNDIEFYVFLHGSRLWNRRKYNDALKELERRLSVKAGIHVEFKIDSLARFREEPISMFSYDLVSAHKIVAGPGSIFHGCEAHRDAERLPISEATRLLFNRCSGLLLVSELLKARRLYPEQCDFIGRNLAKAALSFGDAVLTAFGQYHWSCLERRQRLERLAPVEAVPDMAELRRLHNEGVEFKLHPSRARKSLAEFAAQHASLARLASQLWLWIESRRLGQTFDSAEAYAFAPMNKCPGTSPARNYLLNLKSFGKRCALALRSCRYPRERLFNSLPLLLWEEAGRSAKTRRYLQDQLQTSASDWQGLVNAYKELWPGYG